MNSELNSKANGYAALDKLFQTKDHTDYKWINPKEIIVSQWARMKCMFGCGEYGNNASCPPNVPSVAECEKFFHEYSDAVIFRFQKKVDKPEDRHKWSRKVNSDLLKLERAVFFSNYPKAFLFFMDSCSICAECTGERGTCKEPRLSRPSPEAFAVDVFSTVRRFGFPIEVLSDYSQTMNRFSFLMIQ